jgi:hypothetical protein
LRTGQPFPHSAIIANENFFSHAKEVLRGYAPLAKCCFRRLSKSGFIFPQKKGLPA